tara:strand:+ start:2436 stop:2918 length:483 start_codon:yes stop_codon:yes gene_type:complete
MLNLLDFILILFLLWKGWKGMKNGFIIELGGFIILYISFIVSTTNNILTSLSEKIMINLNLLPDLSWLFSFIFVYIILFILLRLIHNAIESLSLGFVNKFLGLFFGILKWWLIFNIIIFILLFINEKVLKKTELNIFKQKVLSKSVLVNIMRDTISYYNK